MFPQLKVCSEESTKINNKSNISSASIIGFGEDVEIQFHHGGTNLLRDTFYQSDVIHSGFRTIQQRIDNRQSILS